VAIDIGNLGAELATARLVNVYSTGIRGEEDSPVFQVG
jgi:hypothetical protein